MALLRQCQQEIRARQGDRDTFLVEYPAWNINNGGVRARADKYIPAVLLAC